MQLINPFLATGNLLIPLKQSKNLWFSNAFSGKQKDQWYYMGKLVFLQIVFLNLLLLAGLSLT